MRVIQICGKAPTLAGLPVIVGAERWIIGSAYQDHVGAAIDRIFDVHPLAYIHERRPDAWAWYQDRSEPVYLLDAHDEVPTSCTFPRARIRRHFGPRAANAFSSSIDHAIALALLEGCDLIRLDGVRMNSVEEWVLQRECLSYWIGRAEAMGIEVVTDEDAALVTPEVVYGFDERTGSLRAPGALMVVYGVPGAVQ